MSEQYDYRGTAQSRMYDWLVIREGASLRLCHDEYDDREGEDLEYIRELVERDHESAKMRTGDTTLGGMGDLELETPKARSGGVDYYDRKGGLSITPEPLGIAPEPIRTGPEPELPPLPEENDDA